MQRRLAIYNIPACTFKIKPADCNKKVVLKQARNLIYIIIRTVLHASQPRLAYNIKHKKGQPKVKDTYMETISKLNEL